MPAAVRSATAVETAATMGLSAAVEAVTAVELAASVEVTTATVAVAAVEVSAAIAAIESAPVSAATVIASTASVTTVSAAVVAAPVISVIPGAGADEDAACEPIRPVEAVGGAGVRIIIVVAVSADRRGAVIGRGANSDAEGDALGLRVRSAEETNSETNAE
jgi:hypothetical protein